MTDDQAEQLDAICRECGEITPGTWQHTGGGRRTRTPSDHKAPRSATVCPGTFASADLVDVKAERKAR